MTKTDRAALIAELVTLSSYRRHYDTTDPEIDARITELERELNR